MSYRCSLCPATVPAGRPMQRIVLKRPGGSIFQEIPVCPDCNMITDPADIFERQEAELVRRRKVHEAPERDPADLFKFNNPDGPWEPPPGYDPEEESGYFDPPAPKAKTAELAGDVVTEDDTPALTPAEPVKKRARSGNPSAQNVPKKKRKV